MNKMNKIEKQQEIAIDLLQKLFLLCPDVKLSGGAPRDWIYGRVANDLDIYISNNMPYNKQPFIKDKIELLGFKLTRIGSRYSDDRDIHGYMSMNGLQSVYKGIYKGQTVHIIVMEKGYNIDDIYNTYACSLSLYRLTYTKFRKWYIEAHIDAMKTHQNKKLYIYDPYDSKHPYIRKILDRKNSYNINSYEVKLPSVGLANKSDWFAVSPITTITNANFFELDFIIDENEICF